MTTCVCRWAVLALCLWCGAAGAALADSSQVVLFFGDSLTAGYGLDQRQAFPALIPFLLEEVGGVPELNQADGIHPTAEGQRQVAATVWKTLEPVLRQRLRP